jgi:hypothetical protein
MRIQKWYWVILAIWLIIGFPVILIGIGFAGPEIFSLEGLLDIFTPDFSGYSAFFSWLSAFIIAFAPVLLLPFAVKFDYLKGDQRDPPSRP